VLKTGTTTKTEYDWNREGTPMGEILETKRQTLGRPHRAERKNQKTARKRFWAHEQGGEKGSTGKEEMIYPDSPGIHA